MSFALAFAGTSVEARPGTHNTPSHPPLLQVLTMVAVAGMAIVWSGWPGGDTTAPTMVNEKFHFAAGSAAIYIKSNFKKIVVIL